MKSPNRLWSWLRISVALALFGVVLSVVYGYAPSAKQSLRSVAPGAAVAVVAWAITSVGFSVYLATFADYGVTYGSLGVAVGLLLYFYVSASILLAGVEVNAAIHNSEAEKKLDPSRDISNTQDGRTGDA